MLFKKTKNIYFIFFIIFVLLNISITLSFASDKTYKLKLAQYQPTEDYINYQVAEQFIKRVAELSNGRIIINHYPGDLLGGWETQQIQVKQGSLDICLSPASATFAPELEFTRLPYIVFDWESAKEVYGFGKGFALSDVIVENTYITQAVEHAYIERECSVATSNLSGYLTIWTPTQSVNRDRRQISKALGLKFSQVRVIQTTTGGAFGGKDDITSEMYSALLASYTGRPVRYSMTREESFYSTTKRHPFKIVCKTGANKEGKLMALEGKIYGDTGGFASLGPFVVKRGGLHLSGPYHIPNIKVDTYTVYTNNVPSGAFRGFGVPQSAFAHESQMDMLAEKLNMSPVDIRLLNCLRPGLSNATGQVFQHGIGIGKTLEIAKEYYLKLKQEGGLQK
jgi:CO/xanthine dehydrogenase Mo-binding subunit